MTKIDFKSLRENMVATQLRGRDITDKNILRIMNQVPRENFLPDSMRGRAYEDGPVPIGYDQTISQPYIVAYMIQALELMPTDRVLEIGTGCGYNAAIMSHLVKEVYSIEVVASLAKQTSKLLKKLKYKNIFSKLGDGYKGWPEKAPFDVIILTAAPPKIPKPLIDQLAEGGRLIVPEGESEALQQLVLIKKVKGELKRTELLAVRFVPMTGEAQK